MENRLRRITLPMLLTLALAACESTTTDSSGAADDEAAADEEPTLALTSFSVEGSYEPDADGTVPITPSINEGKFTMSWTVEGFDPTGGLYDSFGYNYYDAEVVLSEDQVEDDEDITLFWAHCGDPDYVCDENGIQTQECLFTSDGDFKCFVPMTDGDDMYFWTFDDDNMDTFLADGLPAPGYLVITVCDWLRVECTSEAVPVELQ